MGLPHAIVHGTVGGDECSADDAGEFEGMLRRELAKYPQDLLRRAKLQRVVLVRGLTFNGTPWAGVPDFASRTLYLEAVRGKGSPQYRERLLHHELFHMIDEAAHGTIRNDPEWKSLNPSAFRYARTASTVAASATAPGFITGYSQNAVEEDKAELFSCLVVMPAETSRRAAGDVVLARRFEVLRDRLHRFCPGAPAALFPG